MILPAADGTLNRWLGWSLLIAGLLFSATVDPWLMSTPRFDSERLGVRHAGGVVLAMGFLQLAMSHLLATRSYDIKRSHLAGLLTSLGASLYACGYAVGLLWPVAHTLVLAGSLFNFGGFVSLLLVRPDHRYARQIRMVLSVACFGMALDFFTGTLQVFPASLVPDYLGTDDGIRLRMLRLARVAAIALSALTLLYYGIVERAVRTDGDGGDNGGAATGLDLSTAHRGGLTLAAGAIGMPAILTLCGMTSLSLKYLLPLPATAVIVGVFLGLWYAVRAGTRLERWGWLLVAGSLSTGMLMGLYAFDGPLPSPHFLGGYSDHARRLSRLSHSYGVVLGMLSIFLARELQTPEVGSGASPWAQSIFVIGTIATLSGLTIRMFISLPPWLLGIGPGLTAAGIVIALVSIGRGQPRRISGLSM
jgi:hypothetical protein